MDMVHTPPRLQMRCKNGRDGAPMVPRWMGECGKPYRSRANVAEGCGNRTHREPKGPANGFEDRETHQDPFPSLLLTSYYIVL